MLLDYQPNSISTIFVLLIFVFAGCSGGAKKNDNNDNCVDLLTEEESNSLKATISKQIQEWSDLQVVKSFIEDHQNEASLKPRILQYSPEETAPTSYYWDPIEHWVINSWGNGCYCCNFQIDYDYSDGFVEKQGGLQCDTSESHESFSRLLKAGTPIYIRNFYGNNSGNRSKVSILNYSVESKSSFSFSDCSYHNTRVSILPFGSLKSKLDKAREIGSKNGIPSEPCVQTETIQMNIGDKLVIDMERKFSSGVTSGTAKVLYHGEERLNTGHLSISCSSALDRLLTIYPGDDDPAVWPWL